MMHKVLHSFGDWELDTRHMTRLEKSIILYLRGFCINLTRLGSLSQSSLNSTRGLSSLAK